MPSTKYMDQRTSAEYKAFQDQLRGKNVRKTDTTREEMIDTRTLKDQVEDLKTRLARVEEALYSVMAAERLSQAGQDALWTHTDARRARRDADIPSRVI